MALSFQVYELANSKGGPSICERERTEIGGGEKEGAHSTVADTAIRTPWRGQVFEAVTFLMLHERILL